MYGCVVVLVKVKLILFGGIIMSDDRMDEFIDEFLLRFKKATGFDFATGKMCASTQPPQGQPLIQGYTAEQWQEIIDGGYSCEFRHIGSEPWRIMKLGGIFCQETEDYIFKDISAESWAYCRPAQIKGVMRPIFVEPVDDPYCVFFDVDGKALHTGMMRFAFRKENPGYVGDVAKATKYIEL